MKQRSRPSPLDPWPPRRRTPVERFVDWLASHRPVDLILASLVLVSLVLAGAAIFG